MKKTLRYRYLFMILVSLFVGSLAVQKVDAAKTVSWSTTNIPQLDYKVTVAGGTTNLGSPGGYGKALASKASVSVTYNADLKNADTNAVINHGATVAVGTKIRCEQPYTDTDISWFGTGYTSDSPNGHWVNNAGTPSSYCASGDYVNNVTWGVSGGSCNGNVHVPLNLHRPTSTCNITGPVTKLNTNTWEVTGAGALTATATFPATYGKFYYGYMPKNQTCSGSDYNKCLSNSDALVYDAGGVYSCLNQASAAHDNCINTSYGDTNAAYYCATDYQNEIWSCYAGYAIYQLTVPQQTISFSLTAAGASNAAPNAPTITGPTTGAPNTSYSFAFKASDPNSDTVRYGIDWDNNNTVDAWLPASGYVASNTSQSSNYSWTSTGAKTFKAQTQDSKGATSGWSSPFTITLASGPVPTLNFTINNSAGPLSVALGANLNLVWNATNVTSCTAYGSGWSSGGSIALTGNTNISATASDSYIVNCTGSNGNISSSITVNLANTLKVCQNSCSSGVQRGNTSSTQSFTLAQGGTQNLVSCFNPSSSCNDATGNVTGSTTWGEQSGNNTVALSGTNPKIVTGNNGGSENISASYSSQTNNMTVNVACLPTVSCDNAPGRENYCQSDTFTVDNGCGVTLNCNGTKSCNYNWKEVAP